MAQCLEDGTCLGGPFSPSMRLMCRLDPSSGARQFWNYQRRQLYVMDTYCNAHNRRLNHIMLALHCYLSWAFVIAVVLTGLEMVALVMGTVLRTEVSTGGARVSFIDSGHCQHLPYS